MILEALWASRRLKFQYEKSDGESSDREVDPLGLVARGNHWYLVAAKGDERRTYRVSRIRAAEILAEPCLRLTDSISPRTGKLRRIASASTCPATTQRSS